MAPKYISSRPSASVTVVFRIRRSSSVIGLTIVVRLDKRHETLACRSDLAQHGHHLAADYRVVALDGRVGGVVRHQPDPPLHSLIHLDRALNLDPIEQRGHDVTVF